MEYFRSLANNFQGKRMMGVRPVTKKELEELVRETIDEVKEKSRRFR